MKISEEDREFVELHTKLCQDFKDPEKRKKIIESYFQLAKTVSLYKTIIEDVMQEKNLERWDKDISETIEEINLLIKQADRPIPGYEKMKNELFFLKYLIAEKK